jgi:adenylate kinase family enzyme
VRKVAVIGSGGSGKSHVARALGALLHAPVTHLDALYFDETWTPRPIPEFESRQRTLAAQPTWVMDGNYNTTLPIRLQAADTVIFLDLAPLTCLYAATRRQLTATQPQNPTTGEYNRLTPAVARYILTYRTKMRPKVRNNIATHAPTATLITLTTRRQVRTWLASLAAGGGSGEGGD